MDNLKKYNEIFIECFEVEEHQLNAELVYNSILNWDSVGHMAMIAELEDAFEIMMDTDDIIEFSSYEIGKDIIRKYGVEI